ncbi:MAG TPA: cache domain-containing protein [Dongiaceae bacterium]|nr:cache domain-containing protein [Dongiaceae bacterium]
MRIGVPVLGVVLVIAAILGIALYSHHVNRQGVLALSDQLLTTLDRQIAERVAGFLEPAGRALQVLRDLALRTPSTERRAVAESFAASAMKQIPQISAFYIGDNEGNFSMARRGSQTGVTEIKQIINNPGRRHVFWIGRDEAGKELSRREDPQDNFDPRTRPWYHGALETEGTFWTNVYIFYTEKKPGLTASTRLLGLDGKDYVLGVDITLDELSTFLASLKIGTSGRALIIDGQGRLIAAPNSDKLIKPVGENFESPRLDEIGDPVLTAAFDRFRVEGQGRRVLEFDGEAYVSSATPLPDSARDWWILIVVPESDFTGFVATNQQRTLAMSLVIVVAVAILAFLLSRQSLRYDRSLRRMVEHGRVISQQSSAYAAIAEQSEQFVDGEGRLPPVLTESLTELTNARRISIWRLTSDGQVLHCDESFDAETKGHASGFQLHRREMPRFFEFLKAGEEAEIADAASDPRSAQFYQLLMQPLGSRALFVVPLHRGDNTTGVLCLEDAETLDGFHTFVHTVAGMAALQLRNLEEPDHEHPTRAVQSSELKVQERSHILPADLKVLDIDPASPGAELYSGVAVMILRFSPPAALAKKAGGNGSDLAASIAQAAQEEATACGVRYLKFVSQQVIAAAGPEGDAETAMVRIGALSVALRERCTILCEAAGQGAEFRVGLDCGVASGCAIGDEPRQFNLWGDALETAEAMASSATPGAIQVSEAAYALLRKGFLLRPRGSFYIPGIGEARTFVLAGQL